MSTRQRGASLIEVLISLMLVAVTMLGLLGVQLRSMSLQKDSLDRRNAAILVAEFANRVSGNFGGFDGSNYLGTMGIADATPANSAACLAPAACTSAEVARRDWVLFQMAVRNRLPAGVADIRPGVAGSSLLVTVGWLDPQRVQEAAQLSGTAADLNADGLDDVCVAIGVNDQRYRCYIANVMP